MNTQNYKYFAFLSYSRKDSKAAFFLKRQLEKFRYPIKLVQKEAVGRQRLPLGKIFLDRRNLSVSRKDFQEEIRDAVRSSRFLIFLASPDSARSETCDQLECRYFLETHENNTSAVLPVLLRGRVHCGTEEECLCSSLRIPEITCRNLPNMQPEGEGEEIIAWRNALPAIIGYLLHVEASSVGRVIDAEKRRVLMQILTAVTLAMLIFALLTCWAFAERSKAIKNEVIARKNEEEAIKQTQISEEALLFMTEVFESADPREGGAENLTVLSAIRENAIPRIPSLKTPELKSRVASALGAILVSLNDTSSAQQLLEQALEISRSLSRTDPGTYLPETAKILSDRSVLFRSLGEYSKAAADVQESLKIYQGLEEKTPGKYLPQIAVVLNNLGNYFVTIKDFDSALTAYQESLKIRRKLASAAPEKYMPMLAVQLMNLGTFHHENMRYEEAEACFQEAVPLFQKLAAQGFPCIHDLADALNNYGILLRDSGKWAQAEKKMSQSLEIYRELARTSPEAFLPDAADVLCNIHAVHEELEKLSLAEQELEEAESILTSLAKKNPAKYEPSLARVQFNFALYWNRQGNLEKSLEKSEPALKIYRVLTQKEPQIYGPNLALLLNAAGSIYRQTGRTEDSEKAFTEAVGILREIAPRTPDLYEGRLADTLGNLGNLHARTGQNELLREEYVEALALLRKIVQRNPAPKNFEKLVGNMLNWGYHLDSMENYQEAESVLREAVSICRIQAEKNDSFRRNLVDALSYLGYDLSLQKRFEESETVFGEAVNLARKLYTETPAELEGMLLANTLDSAMDGLFSADASPEKIRPMLEEAEKLAARFDRNFTAAQLVKTLQEKKQRLETVSEK